MPEIVLGNNKTIITYRSDKKSGVFSQYILKNEEKAKNKALKKLALDLGTI